jgi:integrase
MDQEDLTLLYEQILTVGGVENSAYVAARLAEFHRWAARLGADEPDWSGLPETTGSARVSPGVLTEAEYQAALRLLCHRPTDEPRTRLAHAFLLLGCHRFGLRGAECLGLARDDWIDDPQGAFVVLVRNHRFRTLKTPAARRQVPLLFELSALEREVMSRFLLAAESRHGDPSAAPLFAQSTAGKVRFDRLALTAVVNQALKEVTGNPCLSLHHVRHTAINRIAVALLSLPTPTWQRACQLDGRGMNRADLEDILLGRIGSTRRSAWAMARYLGHAGTGTLFRNYLHILDEWIRHLPGAALDKPALGRPTREVSLEDVPRDALIDTSLLKLLPAPSAEITADQALQFMRLLARGKPLADAAAALSVAPGYAEAIVSALERVGGRMRLRPLDRQRSSKDDADGTAFLRRITEAGWRRLIHAAKAAHEQLAPPAETMAAMPCLSEAAQMIGPTRQLVMWAPGHFGLVRAVCDFLGIGGERYVVVHSADWTPRHQEAARAAGFAAIDAKSAGGRRVLQLDSVVEGDNDNRVEKRCVFLFQQNADFAIRDRMEMAAAFLAVAAVICPLPSGDRALQ